MRNSKRKQFADVAIAFFTNELNLTNSKWKLLVSSQRNMVSEQSCAGGINCPAQGLLVLFLDSRLNMQSLLTTIAHEMVHVKQYAKGQLRYQEEKRKVVPVWLGKFVKETDYYSLPWELEAYGKERLLANKFIQFLQDSAKIDS